MRRGNRRTLARRQTRVRILLALVLVLGVATSCGDDDGSAGDESSTRPSAGGDLPAQVVVFTSDDAETDIHGEAITWTPPTGDVLAAERALAAYIDAHPDLGVDPLDAYARQYVGVGPGDGELVSANALCDTETLDDWRDELIYVNDGGTCFWQALYDPALDRVVDFTVNGEA